MAIRPVEDRLRQLLFIFPITAQIESVMFVEHERCEIARFPNHAAGAQFLPESRRGWRAFESRNLFHGHANVTGRARATGAFRRQMHLGRRTTGESLEKLPELLIECA